MVFYHSNKKITDIHIFSTLKLDHGRAGVRIQFQVRQTTCMIAIAMTAA